MKTSTVVIAVFWLGIGGVSALYGAAALVLGAEYRADGIWVLCWGMPSVVGAISLLARRAFGWWVIVLVNGLAPVWMVLCLVHGRYVPRDRDLSLVLVLALCVMAIALLLDRPSKWQLAGSTGTDN